MWAVQEDIGCLGYIRDYTTQLSGDYNKPRIPMKQPVSWKVRRFFRGSCEFSLVLGGSELIPPRFIFLMIILKPSRILDG